MIDGTTSWEEDGAQTNEVAHPVAKEIARG